MSDQVTTDELARILVSGDSSRELPLSRASPEELQPVLLTMAARGGNVSFMERLLEYIPCPDDDSYVELVHVATRYKHDQLALWFLRRRTLEPFQLRKVFEWAVKSGMLEVSRFVWEKLPSPKTLGLSYVAVNWFAVHNLLSKDN